MKTRKSIESWRGWASALALIVSAGAAVGQNVATVAGNGNESYSGDGGPAGVAALNHPRGLAVSANGTVYLSDVDNFRIRAVGPTGTIYGVAGNGFSAESGDGGMATNASVSDAMAVALDSAGNLYIADSSNRRVRKITASGVITTVAGVGVEGFSGDGGPATQSRLGRPVGLAFDGAGNLYIADSTNNRVRRIDGNGIITTVAGNGVAAFSGDGGLAINASLKTPTGVTVDKLGNLYVADADDNRIRRITPSGLISTYAGNGQGGFSGDGGASFLASLNIPYDVMADGQGNLYIADAGNNRIRKVDPSGVITTLAGTGSSAFAGDGGPAVQASFDFPWGLAADAGGNLYVADRSNSRVRKIAGVGAFPPIAVQPPPTGTAPSFQSTGVLNGASFVRNTIAPGGIVAIFGTNLASAPASAGSIPLPTVLGQTSVTFNGVAAPLYYVSSTQINVQAPFDLPMGAATVQVQQSNLTSAPQTVTVGPVSPGIFLMDAVANTGVMLHSDFTFVNSAAPARPGETLVIYATGLGSVQVPVKTGDKAPSTAPLAATVVVPSVSMGGLNAIVAFSGLAPGFVGVYQVNVVVPSGLVTGNQPVEIVSSGVASNIVQMPVGR